MKHSIIIFIIGLICGLSQWLVPEKTHSTEAEDVHFQWPDSFEGKQLSIIPMTAVEYEFSKGFPGALANFRCGNEQVILRHVTRATRKLHPAVDCFRASGYSVGSVKTHTRPDNEHWSGTEVIKGHERFFLRERIIKIGDPTSEWTDVSSWYWHAITAPAHGPWLAITVISRIQD